MSQNFLQYKQIVQDFVLVDNEESYLLCCGAHTIKIDYEYYTILNAMKNADTPSECVRILQSEYKDLQSEQCDSICGVVIRRIQESLDEEMADYTHGNISICSLEQILPYLNRFQVLFIPRVFFTWFCVCTVLGSMLIAYNWVNISTYTMDVSSMPYYMLIFFLIGLLHESGHITAASRVSDAIPKVFFGFYMFIPVFYADVSHIWQAKRLDRIVVTMAGYAVQMIFTVICLYIGLYNDFLFNIGLISFVSCVLGLFLPFGRSDGYWLLVDITGITNLMQDFYQRLYTWNWTGMKPISLAYGVTNLCFMVAFFVYSIQHLYAYVENIPAYSLQNIQHWNLSFSYGDLIAIAMVLFLCRITIRVSKFAFGVYKRFALKYKTT